MLSKEMFSRIAPPTQLSVMHDCSSPGLNVWTNPRSGATGGLVVTVPWMLLKEMLRTIAGLRFVVGSVAAAAASVVAAVLEERRPPGPMLMLIGPVTS